MKNNISYNQSNTNIVNDLSHESNNSCNNGNSLDNSEDHYRTIFENIQDVFFKTNIDGSIIEISSSVEHYTNLSRNELMGASVFSFYMNADDSLVLMSYLKKDGKIRDYELVLKMPSNEIKYISVNAKIIRGQSKEDNFIVGVLRDLTHRKVVEMALQESANKYKSILQTANDAIIITNEDSLITSWNKAAVNIFGYLKHEILGAPLAKILPDCCNKLLVMAKNLKKEQEDISKYDVMFEGMGRNKEGVEIPIELSFSTWELSGKQFGTLIIRNITSRKFAEKELIDAKEKAQESEARYKRIIDTVPNGIVVHQHGKVLMVNEEILKISGSTDENDFIGKTMDEFIHPDYLNNAVKRLNYLYENEVQVPYIFEKFKKIDGTYIELENTSIPTTYNGEKAVLTIMRDVSELMIAKEKAQESDRLKSAFLANMSHEIRTPLNAILGFSELLMEEDITLVNRNKFLQIVNSSGKRLLNIISDIIDVSKLDVKQLTINNKIFNLNVLMDHLYEQFKISKHFQNVELIVVKPLKEEDSYLNADEHRLTQVLSNLLENALKFTSEGTIEFGYSLIKNNSKIQFFVKDSGDGIAVENHYKIFQRFGQVQTDYLKNSSGTGLGLAIVKGIVELLGGEIKVRSDLGEGAHFYFSIPNNFTVHLKMKVENENKVNNFYHDKSTKTILIAEDEINNFLYLEELLIGQNFKILHAVNGLEAIEMFQTNTIDLVLSDINMPIMSGFEAVKKIRELNNKIPIIAITAYAMIDDHNKIIKAGFNDYITKPLSKTTLLPTIFKYLSQSIEIN